MENKLTSLKESKRFASQRFWIIFISIFYLVGIVGISLEQIRDTIVPLSSFHLLLTFVVLYFSRIGNKNKYLLYVFVLFFYGMLLEVIGTKTGLLFGDYFYGETLDAKLFGVPLIIGINWATMVVCSCTLVKNLKGTIFFKILVASILMTALDFLIEPVAMELDFWQWKNGIIPIFNYVCWFLLSLPMNYFYLKWALAENNRVPKFVYLLMVIFFVVLNLI